MKLEGEYRSEIENVPDKYKTSAYNLVHYLAIRQHDIRQLQMDLSTMGLSSLGRMESHVMTVIETVMSVLESLSNGSLPVLEMSDKYVGHQEGDQLLREHTMELLGPVSGERNVRIMVTLPSHAAHDRQLIIDLLEEGMEIARINSAHDDPSVWEAMMQNILEASEITGKKCRILMDLGGPKIRTGELKPGPRILRFNPERDVTGHVNIPLIVTLIPDDSLDPNMLDPNHIPVDPELLYLMERGDLVKLLDVPGRKRKWKVIDKHGMSVKVEMYRSSFIATGTRLQLFRNGSKLSVGSVGLLPRVEDPIVLRKGDFLELTHPDLPGGGEEHDRQGNLKKRAHIPCTLPETFTDLKPGERVFFDDGKIGGKIATVSADKLIVEITRAAIGGVKLRSDKGINFPDSTLAVPSVTDYDKEVLSFALGKVDLIGMSFARHPEAVLELEKFIIEKANGISSPLTPLPSLILKIETKEGFNNLPDLLLAGLQQPPFGVMVARGDLGVEVGFERMAEVQEQILWLCEAAHVPVIWATQVLEQMNKKGLPSRSEVTDAAMSARAECVMLNKGGYLPETVRILNDILLRMRDHHQKKSSMLRRLKVSEGRWRGN